MAVQIASAKRSKGLDIEQFRFVDDLGLPLPQLVLGIEYDPKNEYTRLYSPKPGRRWLKIAHQTAARQRYLLSTTLTPKTASIGANLAALANKWQNSRAGLGGVSLDRAVEYRGDLRKLLRADCNVSHRGFEAGYYTIDLDHIHDLAADQLPNDLDELIQWDSAFERAASVSRWSLVCLGRVTA